MKIKFDAKNNFLKNITWAEKTKNHYKYHSY